MNLDDLFAKRLAQLRNQKGVSARDMSLSLGQGAGYINNIENKNLSTTKNDKERHGFGISNVKNAVSRHGGELVINRADGNFTVDITLKI